MHLYVQCISRCLCQSLLESSLGDLRPCDKRNRKLISALYAQCKRYLTARVAKLSLNKTDVQLPRNIRVRVQFMEEMFFWFVKNGTTSHAENQTFYGNFDISEFAPSGYWGYATQLARWLPNLCNKIWTVKIQVTRKFIQHSLRNHNLVSVEASNRLDTQRRVSCLLDISTLQHG